MPEKRRKAVLCGDGYDVHGCKRRSSIFPASIEKMGTEFIDSLVVKGPDFNETDFVLLKNDVVATFQLNMELFGRVIGPFLTANL